MKDIYDADYMHVKRVFEDFEIENLYVYHALYVQSNALWLPCSFYFRTRISMVNSLKKHKSKVKVID